MTLSDIWNLKSLIKAEERFSALNLAEKLVCASIANCYMEMDALQLGWLIRDMGKRKLCDSSPSDEQISDIVKKLVKSCVLIEEGSRYRLADIYYPAAYRFPLNLNIEKFSLSLNTYARSSDFSFEFSSRQNFFSSILMNLLNGNFDNEIFSTFDFSFLNKTSEVPIFNKLLEPFDEEWFAELPEKSQVFFLNYAIYYELIHFKKIISQENQDIFKYFMKAKWYKSEVFLSEGSHNLALYLIFKGNFERAKSYIEISNSLEAQGINAFMVYLFHGSNDSLPLFHEALKQLQRQKSKRNLTFFTLADIFYFINLLQEGSSESLYEASKYIEKTDKMGLVFKPAYNLLHEFYSIRTLGKSNTEKISNYLNHEKVPFIRWLGCFIGIWTGSVPAEKLEQPITELIENLRETGLALPLAELLNLKTFLNLTLTKKDELFLENWKDKFVIPFIARVDQKQKWEFVLDELVSKLNLSVGGKESSLRLIWDLRLDIPTRSLRLIPKEQHKLKNGKWSIGKPVAMDSYYEEINPFPKYYSEQDKTIYKALQRSRAWINSGGEEAWGLLPTLINSPKVYLNEDFSQPLEILKGTAVLMLRENEEGLFFAFQPAFEKENIIAVMEKEKRLRVFEFSPIQLQAAKILSEQGNFPKAALSRLKAIINSLTGLMPVHSCFEGAEALNPIASIGASPLIYAQLEPINEGLKVSFCVKPFGSNGPAFTPGKGDVDVFTEIAGQNLHTQRNLLLEKKGYDELMMNCPAVAEEIGEDCTGAFNSAENSLELLLNLKEVPELIMEWPENVKAKRVLAARFSDFSFKVRNIKDWFSLEGELRIDEKHVIDLQKILKYYRKGNRFIQIEEDQFLAITEEFRRQIEDLQAFTTTDDRQSLFHSSAIQIMEDILSKGKQVSSDKSWHERLNHIKHAEGKSFALPSDFKGELRGYQEEGFKWLSKMSYLGMGSCLADDMGLGKTIEALSIITSRASLGPAFVLAPTSVCSNWYSECVRFSPSLRPILFAQCDRKETIKNLRANDLVICSYGVLQREIEALANIEWSTVALDEAQAIKNMATNRSQAAMLLRGKFKMLMTGTPIENHLAELWNLFRFLNPGLLGSINSFNEKFALPIQSFNDKQAHERLKKLVKPFILRRTKNQVLKDLPERTEITLNVELSQEEANLYESFRREAMEHIKGDSKDKANENKPMIVLAEIMRLRRLCCNPLLVMPNMNIKSSKLTLLESITEDLQSNGHKALIFSQFVDHLNIIRKLFDEKGYKYQYLDGSTTIKARNKAIKDFQNGEGDFFLISLKAGGQGINLTAADYVIHMDPWWNPAVEDQASDRAHRIGQTRPVTIYKLITSNTIEEKIVQLHSRKRDLAEGLLEGTDIAGRISTKELIALINNSAISNADLY